MALSANKIADISLTQCRNADLVIGTGIFSAFSHVKSRNYTQMGLQNALLYSKPIRNGKKTQIDFDIYFKTPTEQQT